jgi:hypothetical protein
MDHGIVREGVGGNIDHVSGVCLIAGRDLKPFIASAVASPCSTNSSSILGVTLRYSPKYAKP